LPFDPTVRFSDKYTLRKKILDKENYVHDGKINNLEELEIENIKNLLQNNGIKQKQNTYVRYSILTYIVYCFSLNSLILNDSHAHIDFVYLVHFNGGFLC
jgi:hypothetical protein